ncbi:MAG TPA: alpha/beta hydrolase, partial [Casimicrobiaceae bacterium]|nr:alpha/beta hydrolase [Casimicrobiaceae bacterium]
MSRLAVAGIAGIVDVVEGMHGSIAAFPSLRRRASPRRPTSGITRLVYRAINGVVGVVGRGLDALLARLEPSLNARSTWRGREPLLAALNGVLGDYLAASGNSLAIPMRLRRGGIPLPDEGPPLAAALPRAGGKLVVL